MNARAFLLLSTLLLTALSVACTRNWHPPADGQWPPPTPTPSCPNQTCGVVPFVTVSQGDVYFPPDTFIPQTHVIRDAPAWEQFWPDEAARPNVDFSQSIVIALEDSWETGGNSLNIEEVVADPAKVTVTATWVVPPPGCYYPTWDMPTSRHHIVSIPWTALPAEFDLSVEIGVCFGPVF